MPSFKLPINNTTLFRAKRFYSLLLLLYLFLNGCIHTNPYTENGITKDVSNQTKMETNNNKVVFTLYLVGDMGNASIDPPDPVSVVLEDQLDNTGKESAIIFLGDNLYPDGLPPKSSTNRTKMENKLMAQIKVVKNFAGQIIFIPGNHDWQSSGPEGLNWVQEQENFIESKLNRGNTFLPDSGKSGPVKITLKTKNSSKPNTYDIQLITLDTQWWLHPHEKPLSYSMEDEKQQKAKILSEVSDLLSDNKNSEIVVAAHHPLFSYGRHGGKFALRTHLTPPVFGSLYVFYRKIWGLKQDLPRYSGLKEGLLSSFEQASGIIYAAGHDHSLQYIPYRDDHFLVSGSASKVSYVREKNNGVIMYEGLGFIKVLYYADRSKKIEFWNKDASIVRKKFIDHKPIKTH